MRNEIACSSCGKDSSHNHYGICRECRNRGAGLPKPWEFGTMVQVSSPWDGQKGTFQVYIDDGGTGVEVSDPRGIVPNFRVSRSMVKDIA